MAKEGSSDYEGLDRDGPEWFFREPNLVLLWARCEEAFRPLYI